VESFKNSTLFVCRLLKTIIRKSYYAESNSNFYCGISLDYLEQTPMAKMLKITKKKNYHQKFTVSGGVSTIKIDKNISSKAEKVYPKY
jgi:hypothetical protein